MTLEGSKCNLSVLIDVVSHTKGYIRIVKPFKLRDEFYSVIEKKILVTNARVVLILPKQLYVKSKKTNSNEIKLIKINSKKGTSKVIRTQ